MGEPDRAGTGADRGYTIRVPRPEELERARALMIEVVALDYDPVLMAIGRNAMAPYGERLAWADVDLARGGWLADVAPLGPFDAVVSLAALHHLGAAQVRLVYRSLAALLPAEGLFANAEGLAAGGPHGARVRAMIVDS